MLLLVDVNTTIPVGFTPTRFNGMSSPKAWLIVEKAQTTPMRIVKYRTESSSFKNMSICNGKTYETRPESSKNCTHICSNIITGRCGALQAKKAKLLVNLAQPIATRGAQGLTSDKTCVSSRSNVHWRDPVFGNLPRMRICVLAIALLLSAAVGALATSPRDLTDVPRPLGRQYSRPGFVGAIMHGDKIVAMESVGVRNVGDRTPFLTTD